MANGTCQSCKKENIMVTPLIQGLKKEAGKEKVLVSINLCGKCRFEYDLRKDE